MIWLASFPRSGNTFMRNLFYDVFNIESASYPPERNHIKDKNYLVTKTHKLPCDIPSFRKEDFVIYLIRDGRDSIVSNSHYRKNFLDENSDFNENIKEGIVAPLGTHFGGWSKNAYEWSKHADIIIRFEDLINDPVASLKQIIYKIELPPPDFSKIKNFSELKNGMPKYGSGGKGVNKKKFAEKFFHKGKIGASKLEMPDNMKKLFWLFHGDIMENFGYTNNNNIEEYNFKTKITVKRNRNLKALIITKHIKFKYFFKWFLYSFILGNEQVILKK